MGSSPGDWIGIVVAIASSLAAIFAAIAAFQSKGVAKKGVTISENTLKLQKGIIQSERKRNLRATLRENAIAANYSVGDTFARDWNFGHIHSITNYLNASKTDILCESEYLSEQEIEELKAIFLGYLSSTINMELHEADVPKGIHVDGNGKMDMTPLPCVTDRWKSCRKYFKLKDK